MRPFLFTSAVLGLLAGVASAGSITGEYLEARNADVWTGPCFANGEMGIVGDKAILAWKVNEGSVRDVALDGLSVVAVVMGDRTFGLDEHVRTRTLFIVDERATNEQQTALVNLARELAGDTVQQVVGIQTAPVELATDLCTKGGCAHLRAGEASIHTRCMCEADSICGHETLFYPPLATVTDEYAAYTIENRYSGGAFGRKTFRDNNARSSIIARFTTDSE